MHIETSVTKNPLGNNDLTIRINFTDDERTGLTYRHKIRETITCPVVGVLSLAAMAQREGLTLFGLCDYEIIIINEALRIELPRVADRAVLIARQMMDSILPQCGARIACVRQL